MVRVRILQIYHNGSNSYIVENGTGDLFLGATNLRLTNGSVASTYLQGTDGGAVDIRHNNLIKLATTSTGIQVTGNIANASGDMTIDTAGDLILDAANNDIILKDHGTTFGQLTNDSGNLIIYNSGSQMLKGLSTGPNAEFIGTVKIPKLGINASANSNYSLYALQNGSITHAAYLQVNGGTATGLEINASASSAYSGDVLYARQSSRNTGGNLARFANSDGDKFTLTTAGQATFSNDVIIGGNLTVNGSTTTINSTTLTVDDLNITLASGAANASAANGAGITVDGASATLTYVSSTDTWDFNKNVKFNTVQAHGSNNFLVDSPGEIILDSSSRIVRIYHDGGNIGAFQMTNNDFYVRSMVADRDLIFQGYDGSSNITALSLDMSEAGKAIFNAGGSFTGDVTVRSGNKLILNRADNATGGEITYGPTGTGFIINDVNGDDTIFKTGSSEHMRIHSNGNVGIGTGSTALSVKFHAYTTGYPVAKFERYGSSAATRGWTQIGHSSLSYTGATGADTYIVTQHGFGVAVNEGTNALTITDGGLVGIGTSNPDEKLVVSGDGARIYINSTDYHIAMIGRRGSSGTALDQGYIRLKDQGTNTVVLDSAGNSYLTGGSLGIGTNSPEGELTLQDDDATLRIRSNTTTTKGLSLRYNHSGNFGELLVDHQGNNQLDMKYYALTHKFGRNDSSQFVTIADDGATTITSADSILLTLNPTANNYGGIAFQYGGATKGMSIFNSGMMVYGGESQVSTALQAGGQYGLFIHHSTRHVGIGMSNATPSSVLNVRGDGGGTGLSFKTEDASANETFFVQDGGRVGVRYYPLTVGIPSSTAAASGAAFQVEEAGHLFVNTTGNTGIGTTSPGAVKLYVTTGTDSNLAGQFVNTHTTGSYGLKIQAGSDSSNYGFVVTNKDNANPTQFMVRGDGNIGMGTNSPSRKLHLKNGQIKFENTSSTGWAGLDFSTGNGTYDGYMGMLDSDGRFFIDVDSNGEDLTILQNGRVGIGINNPLGQLQVSGADAPTTHGGIVFVRNTGATASNTTFGGVHFSSSPGTDYSIGKYNVNTTTYLQFRNGNNGTAYMNLDANGNLGIGGFSANSNQRLLVKTVNDSDKSQGLVIERSANSDRGYLNYQGGAFRMIATDGDPIKFGHVSSSDRVTIGTSGTLTVHNNITNDSSGHSYLVLDNGGSYESGVILKRGGSNKWEGPYISGSTSDNDLKFYSYGDSSLQMTIRDGVNANGGLELRGLGVSDGTAHYGHYGALLFDSTTNYTGSARSWMITNAYTANQFAILYGSSAGQFPVLGTGGGAGTNTSVAFSIQNNGVARFHGDLQVGGDVAMDNGRGISFAATGNSIPGSMSNELFDDYEEGTWTITLKDGTGNTYSGSYQSRNGRYTKVGRLVHATFELYVGQVDLTANGLSGNQGVRVAGFPFNSNSNQFNGGVINNSNGINYTANSSICLSMARNVDEVILRTFLPSTGAGESQVTVTQFNNGNRLVYGTIVYEAT